MTPSAYRVTRLRKRAFRFLLSACPPNGVRERGSESCCDYGSVSHGIVARRKKGSTGEAPGMPWNSRQQQAEGVSLRAASRVQEFCSHDVPLYCSCGHDALLLVQTSAAASLAVTGLPSLPNSCRSPNTSMRIDWLMPPTRTGANPLALMRSATILPASRSSLA